MFLSFGAIMASDIQRGITFSPTEHITATKLHNLIDAATINTTFVTDLSAAQPTASDVFLFVQPGTPIYRKTTYNTLLLSATNLITSQSELDLPVTNDFILVFDSSSGTLAKVPLISIFTNAIWAGIADFTNVPAGGFSYPYSYQGNGGRIEHSNLFAGWWQWELFSTNVGAVNPLTNTPLASFHTAPTNADMMLIWDALHQTNKFTTLAGLMTNMPPVPLGLLTNADSLLLFSRATNAFTGSTGIVAQVSVANLFQWGVQRWATNKAILSAAGGYTNAHGLAGTPQIVRVAIACTTAELGYNIGDEIDLSTVTRSDGGVVSANATNVFWSESSSSLYSVARRDTAASASITKANWTLKFYATYLP